MTNTKNRKLIFWLSLLMVLFTVIFTATVTVSADDGWIDLIEPISEGHVYRLQINTDGVEGTDYEFDGLTLKILTDTPISLNGELEYARIEVAAGVDADITLCGATIEHLIIADDSTGDVTLRLADDTVNTLTGNLIKNGDGQDVGTLTICGNGSLTASGGWNTAGIGGSCDGNVANIVIESGNITAVGSSGGSGIGGGVCGSARNIVTKGGVVTAYVADSYAAGIGGGCGWAAPGGAASDIIIMGGSVKANGGKDNYGKGGADIGNGGEDGSGEAIAGDEVQPTDGEEPVYLMEIENPDEEDIVIDGVDYPDTHGDEKKIYAYLTDDIHVVEIGDTKKMYDYDADSDTWMIAITDRAGLEAINDDLGGNYVLGADIDLSGEEWIPIGNSSDAFTGRFDGNGHVIRNLTITSDGGGQGLFYDNYGLIMNVGIEGGSISGYNAGGVCVDNSGTIIGCYNTADVSGYRAGGICGNNSGTISHCYNTGDITGTSSSSNVGGICGYVGYESSVEYCYNTGNISTGDSVGSIVGSVSDSDLHNCYYLQGTAEYGYRRVDIEGFSNTITNGVKTLAELCALDIDGEGTVWAAGNASFTAEDVTVDEDNARFGAASVKPPYLTIFGENDQPTVEFEVYNFSVTDDPDWQVYTPITTAAQLQAVNDDLDGNYVLMNDIDLDGVTWTPIGMNSFFTGKFSGNGKVVKNLTISQSYYIGLFGSSEGLVMNLGVEGTLTSDSGYCVGGIIGGNYGTVSGCYFKGDVSGETWQGGIAGGNAPSGIIDNCFAIGSVTSSDDTGGIVGVNNGTISDCYCVSTVTVTGTDADKGSVCGENSGTITNCIYNKDIYTDEDNTEGVDGLLTLDMTAGNALDTFGFDTDVWGYKAADKENGIAYYPYLKAFGEENAASVSYETKLSIEYDESKGEPVYGEDLYFIISALVKFDGMEEFITAEDSYANGAGSFRLACGGAAITEYFPIYDCSEVEMKTAFPAEGVSVGEQTIWLEYIGDDSDFFCSLPVYCTITIARVVIDSVTIEINAPQPEVALDMEPVVTPEGMSYELVWFDDCNDNVNDTVAEYGNTYRAYFQIWTDGNYEFADTLTVTASAEDFEVELDGDLYVNIYFPTLPKGTVPVVTATPGNGEIHLGWEDIDGADLYRVRRNDGSGWVNYADVRDTSYIDTDVENGKTYKYAVYARVNGAWGKASDIVSAAATGEVRITCAEVYGNTIELEWTEIYNAEMYRDRRNDGSGWVNYIDTLGICAVDEDIEAGKSYRYAVYAKTNGVWSEASEIVTVVVKPIAVENVTAVAMDDGVLVEWDEAAGADLYRIRRNDGSGWVDLTSVETNSYTDTTVVAGKTYRYVVYAVINGKQSAASNTVSCKFVVAAPENVAADAAIGQVVITWDETNGAAEYLVRRNDGSGWVDLVTVDTNEYVDTNVSAGKSYRYAVYAKASGMTSAVSAIVKATVPVAAVTDLTATSDGTVVSLSWTADGDSYKIRRNDGSGWVDLTETTDAAYTDTDVTAATQYRYAVYVCVNGVWSKASNIVSVTV